MAHQGAKACHWCEGCWRKNKAYRRHVFGGHHRWLPRGDPLRKGDGTEAPEHRTPDSVAQDAQESFDSDLPWDDSMHPRRASGVNCASALSLLPMFNIVWDVMPDWMHIIKNLMLGHFIKVVKGERKLTTPHYASTSDDAPRTESAEVKRSCQAPCSFSLSTSGCHTGCQPISHVLVEGMMRCRRSTSRG
jgi:hypothetical protein